MKLTLIIGLFLTCIQILAKDFRDGYCYKYLTKVSNLAHFNNFWTIEYDGTLKLDKERQIKLSPMAVTIKSENPKKIMIVEDSTEYRRAKRTYLTVDNNNKVSEIRVIMGKEGEERDSDPVTEINLNSRNDTCYPVSEMEKDISGKIRNIYQFRFHTEHCNELETYIKNNPQLLECRCGDDITHKGLVEILKKHNDNGPIGYAWDTFLNLKDKNNKPVWIPDSRIREISKPLYQALSSIEKCHYTPGVNEALNDSDLWKQTIIPQKQESELSTVEKR